MLTIRCPRCGAPLQVDEKWAGRLVRCKGCGNAFSIPGVAGQEQPVLRGMPTPCASAVAAHDIGAALRGSLRPGGAGERPTPPLPMPGNRSRPLVPGLLLLLYGLGGVLLLAALNGVFLALLLRLFLGRDQALAARTWVVPLAFLLALAEVGLYEWRRARTVDLVGPLQAALQEVLALLPAESPPRLGPPDFPRKRTEPREEQFRTSLKGFRQLLASPADTEARQRLAVAVPAVLRQLDEMLARPSEQRREPLLRLKVLLEWYQRRYPAGQ
jgi:hypothetical protein